MCIRDRSRLVAKRIKNDQSELFAVHGGLQLLEVPSHVLLIILYKNTPVKSQEVQVDEIVEDVVEEEIPVPDSEYDSDSDICQLYLL